MPIAQCIANATEKDLVPADITQMLEDISKSVDREPVYP